MKYKLTYKLAKRQSNRQDNRHYHKEKVMEQLNDKTFYKNHSQKNDIMKKKNQTFD